MKLVTKCLVCGAVACSVGYHHFHPTMTLKPEMAALARPNYPHPETPELGEHVREPQVAAVTTGSNMPPGHFSTSPFPGQPAPIQPTILNPNWLLVYGTPTAVSSSS